MQPDDRLTHGRSAELRSHGAVHTWEIESAQAPSVLTWEQAVRVMRKHRWFLTAVVGVLTLVTLTVALRMRDTYKSTARIEIDPVDSGISTLQEIENARSEADQEYLDTQVQILQSEGLAVRTIRTLRLDQDPEFSRVTKNVPRTDSGIRSAAFSGPGPQGPDGKEQLELAKTTTAEAAALQAFQAKLSVDPVRGSRLVEVSFASQDPERAQAVANTLVTQFIDQNYRNRYVTTMEASQWLSSQLSDLRQKVADSNRAVTEYQKRFGLVESDEKDVPLGQLMADVSKQVSDAQADRIQAEASVRMLDEGHADAVPALRDDVVYQNLQTRYAEARSQLAQAETVYGDESTSVKKLKSEAQELAAQVDAERGRLIKRVQTTFLAAKSREQMMMEAHEKLRSQMGEASSHLVEYRILRNEAIANAALYNTLEARLREAGIYAGLRSGNIRVVDMAPLLHKPTGPHRMLIVGLGTVLSMVVALAMAFVWESFDNTVRIPDDIKNWTSLPYLGVVPTIRENSSPGRRLGANSLVSGEPESEHKQASYPKLFWSRMQTAEAEAIRTLRFALTRQGRVSPRVILVSSPSAGEGKTTVAVNLAGVLAQQGKTCLIEGDLRRPMIEPTLGLSPKWGLGEVLSGKRVASDVLMEATSIPGLTVLPIKEAPSSPADVLASEGMKAMLNSMREQFDFIVIDSPPVLSFADARSLASLSDAVVLVTRYGRTTRRAITRSAQLLTDLGTPVVGVVLNDMDLGSADYHYFNHGYSRAIIGQTYDRLYRVFPPPALPEGGEPEKSKGAHA